MIEYLSIREGDKLLCVNDKSDVEGRYLLIKEGTKYTIHAVAGRAVQLKEIPHKTYKLDRFQGVRDVDSN